MRITDKMRLDWLENHDYIAEDIFATHDRAGEKESWYYPEKWYPNLRAVIDAAIRAAAKAKRGA